MTDYYNITTKLKDSLINDPLINSVSKGGLDDIANRKKDSYALAHLIVNSCTPTSNTLTYNVSIICMDIVDFNKEETTDHFIGNDNEDDVLNNMLGVQVRLFESLTRGSLFSDLYQVDGGVTIEPFTDRFEDNVAGWTMTLDIIVQNDMTIC